MTYQFWVDAMTWLVVALTISIFVVAGIGWWRYHR
jgi:hypothetical protein